MRPALMAGLAALILAGCETAQVAPPARPAPGAVATSSDSAALRQYYLTVQNDLLAQGLLRTDGGGPDAAFTADDLATNFLAIAFNDEYASPGGSSARRLGRWNIPVRVIAEFGPSVPQTTRNADRESVSDYARRLARVTGHPIAPSTGSANFHVIVAGEDDRAFLTQRLPQLVPGISPQQTALFTNIPRGIYCQVVAFSDPANPDLYTRAVALIRAEHPPLIHRACIHEEIAQGLGLPNDSPDARPSIFNDDDEFALLTGQDELMLKMLYDPRLAPGMTSAQAAPLVRQLAQEYVGLAS